MSNTTQENVRQFPKNVPNRRPPSLHELPLASAIKNGHLMTFVMASSGDVLEGVKVKGFDQWSISIEKADGRPRTIFKHAIESFEAL